MTDQDPDALARIYAASDTGHGVWQMLDSAMITRDWDSAFTAAFWQRFGRRPPPGTTHEEFSLRLHHDEEVYRQVHSAVHAAAFDQMMEHHVMVTDDCPDFGAGLEPAAAAALQAAFEGRNDP